jgi:peptidoglycan/xylan/chitin deacetylase (PgdA/CDA1 family)
MIMRRLFFIPASVFLVLAAIVPPPARADVLLQPGLRLAPAEAGSAPQLALTLDACDGGTDQRIIDTLLAENIPATIFATARWLKRNPDTVKLLLAHGSLFEIENHGARHRPAVDRPIRIYGLKAAGSPEGVRAEVEGGEQAVTAATGRPPRWFRGAAALYTAESLKQIASLHQQVAGYSIAADGGASFSAARTEREMLTARNGDVLLAHVNHPEKTAGAGVVKGLLALKARGYRFVRLDQVQTEELPPKQRMLAAPAAPVAAKMPDPVTTPTTPAAALTPERTGKTPLEQSAEGTNRPPSAPPPPAHTRLRKQPAP